MGQRFDVKPASTDDDRELAARINIFNRTRRDAPIFFRVHFFDERHGADQVMRRFRKR